MTATTPTLGKDRPIIFSAPMVRALLDGRPRLTLAVTNVRVERLNDISEADAVAEGGKPAPGGWWSHAEGQASTIGQASFAVLWNSRNGPDAWTADPWVVAVTFTVHHANIDALDIAARAA